MRLRRFTAVLLSLSLHESGGPNRHVDQSIKLDVVPCLQPKRCSLCLASSYVDLQGGVYNQLEGPECVGEKRSRQHVRRWATQVPSSRRQRGQIEMTSAGLSVHSGLVYASSLTSTQSSARSKGHRGIRCRFQYVMNSMTKWI